MFYNIAPLLHIFHEYDTYFMSMKFNSAEGKKNHIFENSGSTSLDSLGNETTILFVAL
jgi:hypothetical protein